MVVEEAEVVAVEVGAGGLAEGSHARLLRGAARLAMITGLAGADHVIPVVEAASVPGYDVIQGELPGFLAAVLAGVVISNENITAGKPPPGEGTLDQIDEADH
jgi:hypothetical protein